MKKIFLINLLILFYCFILLSQNDYLNSGSWKTSSKGPTSGNTLIAKSIADTGKVAKKSNWDTDLNARLNLTQMGFSNWKAGGENSFAWIAMIDGKYFYRDSSYDWRTNHRFAYGQTKQGDRTYSKNEDLIDFSSVVSYLFGGKIDPYFSVTFRSQFTPGYEIKDDIKIENSNFLDPAYITQNLGFQYIPVMQDASFSLRAGLSFKETITRNHNTYSDDPLTTEIEKTKFQIGSELVCEYEQKINSLASYKTKFEFFTNYKRIDETDIRWDNLLTMRVTKYIAVSLNGIIYYNKDESNQVQWKEIVGIGLFYDFK